MKLLIKILFALLFIAGCTNKIISQTIPSSRIENWSKAGYGDTIPDASTVLDITAFGAIANDTIDDSDFLRSAIDSLHGHRGVIFFPPGNYLCSSPVAIADSIIIRGSSSDSTQITFDFHGNIGNGFNISGSATGNYLHVLSGFERGSTSVIIDTSAVLSAGDYVELLEDNGAWDIVPAPWAVNSVGQILRVASVSSDTVTFESNLRITLNSVLNPRLQKIIPAKEIGIECLKIARADSVHAGVCFNIYFNYAAHCWIRGVESSKSIGSHIEADASTNITISGCYIHHNFEYDGTSTHGYGITLFGHTGECLVENNIMQHVRHAFSMQTGANGNVIAYNYSIDPNRSEAPSNFGADISLHGHFPFSNLFEGNIVQNIQIDQTWGPSGPYNTFFRNRAELYGILMTSGSVQSDSLNFAGNEVPNTGFLLGNYSLAGAGHFEYGNTIRGTVTPAGTTSLSDSSYFLNSRPAYWGNGMFPSIGSPNALSSGSIPARDRFLAGRMTACSDEIITTGIAGFENDAPAIFPNPNQGILHFNNLKLNSHCILYDLSGKIILQWNQKGNEKTLPESIQNGIYFLKINSGLFLQTKKIIVQR